MSRVKGWFLRRWPSLVSAVLLLLAFPPFDLWPLVFVGMAPLLWQLRTAGGKEAWRIGYLFGLVYFLGQMAWLGMFAYHWTGNLWLFALPWVASSIFGATYFGWVSVLMNRCFLRGWPWMVPIVWAGVEVIRTYLPVVAFPWALMGTPLYGEPSLIQLAHFGTVNLVSAWVVLSNLVIALAIDRASRPTARPYLAAFMVLAGISWIQLGATVPSDPFPVTVGQPAVDQAYGSRDTRDADIANSVNRITDAALKDDSQLLVLPEGVGDDDHFPPIPPFRIDPRLPILFGGQRFTNDATYQTSYSYDGHWQYTDKTRLIIFGEFVPGRSLFPGLAKAFDLPAGDLSAGRDGVKQLDVAGTRLGPMLCFEGLFPDIAYRHAMGGAKFLAIMSIDDWYMGTPAPEQLMAGSIFRAVETGLPVVRSASLGRTQILDPHGRIVARLPIGKPGQIHTVLQLPRQSPTFPLLPVFSVCAALAALVLSFWRHRDSKAPSEHDHHPGP